MAKKASESTTPTGKRKRNATPTETVAKRETASGNEQAQVADVVIAESQVDVAEEAPKASKNSPNILSVTISAQLKAKIKDQAADEGISVNDYVAELLAEGVVLRAWEIVEKKNQLRGGGNVHQQLQAQGNGGHRNNHNNNHNNNRRNDRFNRRGMSNNRYNNIMEDKASFLEYVRNQERQQGR